MVFSFIVPVYNVEDYLVQCVDSILAQSGDFELILVNDGSTDSSSEICDQYFDKYPHIVKVIHKQNGGLSDARNTGINNAEGDYILFVDSDDFIENDFLHSLISSDIDLTSDIIFLEAQKLFPNGKKAPLGNNYKRTYFHRKDKHSVLESLAKLPKYPGSACDKMVKRKLFSGNNLNFEIGLLSEDIDWTIRLYLKAESFDYFSHPYYNYRQKRHGSITSTITSKNVEHLLSIIERWSENELVPEIYRKSTLAFLAYEYCVLLANYYLIPKNEQNRLKTRVFDLKWLLKFIESDRLRIVDYLERVFGISFVGKLLSVYLKSR